jgi:hypothetical protein
MPSRARRLARFTLLAADSQGRNLALNPACTISVKLPGMDLTLDGTAMRVTEPAILERMAGIYRDIDWPAGCGEVAEEG